MSAPLRLGGLALLVVVAGVVALGVGSDPLSPGEVLRALVHSTVNDPNATIVWELRAPRVLIAMIVGAALAIAGLELQSIVRNPLVDPYLTGVSAGCGVAASFAVTTGLAVALVPILGFGAGIATAVLVASLARRRGAFDVERLILAGVTVSFFFSALVTLIETRSEPGRAQQIIAWLAGSLDGRGWPELAAATPEIAIGLLLALASVLRLNAMLARARRRRSGSTFRARSGRPWLRPRSSPPSPSRSEG